MKATPPNHLPLKRDKDMEESISEVKDQLKFLRKATFAGMLLEEQETRGLSHIIQSMHDQLPDESEEPTQ
jgi:hypothetical protein